jgi:hypothetical protein
MALDQPKFELYDLELDLYTMTRHIKTSYIMSAVIQLSPTIFVIGL